MGFSTLTAAMAIRCCSVALLFFSVYISPVFLIDYCGNGGNKVVQIRGQHCYHFSDIGSYWVYAQEACEDMGLNLMSIHSQDEQDYVTGNMKLLGSHGYFIGLYKDRAAPGEKESFRWKDGTEVDYEDWRRGEPAGDEQDYSYAYPDKPYGWMNVQNVHTEYFTCKGTLVRGWQPYKGNEYYISTNHSETASTWYEAHEFCMQQGGDVASILCEDELFQVIHWATRTSYQGQLWIGLNKLADDRKNWGWSDGSSFDVTWYNWEPTFPYDEKYGYFCGYQSSDDPNGLWKNGHCDTKKGFVCKRPITSSPTPKMTVPTQTVSGYCPAGYYGSGNKCFKVVLPGHFGEGSLTFEEALVACQQEPGRIPSLASIENELDQAFVNSHLTSLKFGVWIGLRRVVHHSNWIWVDSSPYEYKNWAPNEPEGTKGNCVEVNMFPGLIGDWDNIECSEKRGYICQTYKDWNHVIPTSALPNVNFTCPNGFTAYWYGCYKYQPTALTWDAAGVECEKLDPSATLVGIHAEAENAAVQTLTLTHDNDIWLGFRDRTNADGENGKYKWEDGWHVLWTNWADGQPVKKDQGGCVRMSVDGRWSDDVCSKQYPSVCKISQMPALTTPATLPGKCPAGDGWFEYGEHCYLIITHKESSWNGAEKECQGEGFLSSLASLHSYLENKMILERMNLEGNGNKNVWIGLYRDLDRNRLKWVDGTALQFVAWAPREPNGKEITEDCVKMWNDQWPGQWGDSKCSDNMGYICKAPKTPNMTLPTSYPSCASGWEYSLLTGHCYLFKPDDSQTNDDAVSMCHNEAGADLASVHDAVEMSYIGYMMKQSSALPPESRDKRYWFGLAINQTGDGTYDYYWTDGTERDYNHWYDLQPSNPQLNPCVYVDMATGLWLTVQCEQRHGYVCKKLSNLDTTTPPAEPTEDVPGGGVVGCVMVNGHLYIVVFSTIFGLILNEFTYNIGRDD